jgi:hypothetical protein
MITDQIILNYYKILNGIKMDYLKLKLPYNIIYDDDIKLTYKQGEMNYIKDKNYFIIANKTKKRDFNNNQDRGRSRERHKHKQRDTSNDSPRNQPKKPWEKHKHKHKQSDHSTDSPRNKPKKPWEKRDHSNDSQRSYHSDGSHNKNINNHQKKYGGVDNIIHVFY